jgi:hypothetical protein
VSNEKAFIDSVVGSLSNDIFVLLHQKHTHISPMVATIHSKVKERFKEHFYHFITPAKDIEKTDYYAKLGEVTGSSITNATQFQEAVGKIAQKHKLLLYINNFENNNDERARELSTAIRNLKDAYPNFHAIVIGQEQLSKMCYRSDSTLSPLNNSIIEVFPNNARLEPNNIITLLNELPRYDRDILKEYLDGEDLGYFDIGDDLKMQLFWCNILTQHPNKKLYWKDFEAKHIICEVIAPHKLAKNQADQQGSGGAQEMDIGRDNSGAVIMGNGNTVHIHQSKMDDKS